MKQLLIIFCLLTTIVSCTEDEVCSTCLVTVSRSYNDIIEEGPSHQNIDYCDEELEYNIANPIHSDTVYWSGTMVITTYIYACH